MFTSGQIPIQGYPTPSYRRIPYSEDREIENIRQDTKILHEVEILKVKLVAKKRLRATLAKEKAKKKGKRL
jgi:hypothetical protein